MYKIQIGFVKFYGYHLTLVAILNPISHIERWGYEKDACCTGRGID